MPENPENPELPGEKDFNQDFGVFSKMMISHIMEITCTINILPVIN